MGENDGWNSVNMFMVIYQPNLQNCYLIFVYCRLSDFGGRDVIQSPGLLPAVSDSWIFFLLLNVSYLDFLCCANHLHQSVKVVRL